MDHALKIRRSGVVYKVAYGSGWLNAPACPNVCHLVRSFLIGFLMGVLLWKLFDYVFLRLIGGVIAVTFFLHRPLLRWTWPEGWKKEGWGAIYVPLFKIPRITLDKDKKEYVLLYPVLVLFALAVAVVIAAFGYLIVYLGLYVGLGQELIGDVILPSPEAKIISLASVLAVVLAVAAFVLYGKIRREEWWLLLCAYLKGKKRKVCLPVDFID